MADIMRFDTSQAEVVKRDLNDSAEAIRDILKDVKGVLNSVSEWWKGDSVEKYMDQYDRIEKPVLQLIDSVETIGKQIQATIDDKVAQEQELSSILSNSFN